MPLGIDVTGSILSARVPEVISQLISIHDTLKFLRSDNGHYRSRKALPERHDREL